MSERLWQTSQHSALAQAQLRHIFAEESLRGCLYAISQISVIDLVEIQLEDVFFAARLRQEDRQQDLLGFAGDAALGAFLEIEEDIAHQLLGDGAAARGMLAG